MAARGPGSLEDQVSKLKKSVKKQGVADAAKIIEKYDADIIRLAYKQLPRAAGANHLGKRIDALLLNCPVGKQAEMRKMLLAAKQG